MLFKRFAIVIFIILATIIKPLCADSLWKPVEKSLFADLRPSKVGDLITVLIVEQSSSSQKAGQSFDKSFQHDNEAGIGPFLKLIPELGYTSAQNSSTSGESVVSNKFETKLAAIVTNVQKNGNLEIKAERTLNMNDEKQTIILTGVVRPQDIRSDNTVLSTNLANVRIETIGKGPVGNRTREGFISKILRFLF
ncbi:MAG: flagellar basal body L-ring protein FlgH [Armatimonadota bacterium]|nr:flagellar basal body L-ring protein FlgH [Armatimonadota bacterium]